MCAIIAHKSDRPTPQGQHQNQIQKPGPQSGHQIREADITILIKHLDEIREELSRRTLADIPGYANRTVSIRRAIHELAPTLLEKRESGFKTTDLVAMLKDLQIIIKAPTLARYLKEYQEEQKKMPPEPAENRSVDAVPRKTKSPSTPKKPKADSAPTDEILTTPAQENDNDAVVGNPQSDIDSDSIRF